MQIIECPRDALQGFHKFIPTETKIKYYNSLLKVGFHTLDFGSFVSPKAVPQMKDTAQVVEKLQKNNTKLLAITLNARGANDAVKFPQIDYLGYAFSISETFQLRNTRKNIAQSYEILKQIREIAAKAGKEVVVYISMAFGNPYGDSWSKELVWEWTEKFRELDIKIVSLADTVGNAVPEQIKDLFSELIPAYPDITFGAHFHASPKQWKQKIVAAYESGCRRFDGALKGFGGCPFAQDDLVGNIPTEKMLHLFTGEYQESIPLDQEALQEAMALAAEVFSE